MEELKKYENIELNENMLIHKIQHTFITKEKILKGNTEYTIIDKYGKIEPKTIIINENNN